MTSAWLVPWILAGLACPGQDKQPPPEDSKVKVTVVVILASERCEFIDPERLKAGEWQESIAALLDRPALPAAMRTDGAPAAADAILAAARYTKR